MIWFDYALIRYMPNPKRGETINLGLVVFRESGIDVKVLSSSAKVRMIDGESSQLDIDQLKESIQHLVQVAETSDEQYQLLSLLSDSVFLSNKSQFAVDELSQYENKVDRLFNDLVKPFASKEKSIRTSRLSTQLKHKFEALNLLAKDVSELSKHKIVPNYPINENMGLTADFLLKNGIYHLSEVVDFNVNDAQSKLKETSLKIMTFMMSKKVLSSPVNCYFVYSATPKRENEIIQHINMAEEYSHKIFNMDSSDDYKKYMTLISELTHTELTIMH
ncbi:DUF3037 domain-containing protein [Methylobacter marinus]|uniref:DUF3037 domain-containing protein n=1 Tax=Methylobacter marinus TaxID=34058 RepID=UPI00037B9B2B|nr:DUF3037 domain-containing protein [Methylobacter marinus]